MAECGVLTVLDPSRQRLRAEAGEYHRVHRADPRTRQHGRHRHGRHGHVHGHPVALVDAVVSEGVGDAAGRLQQLSVAEMFFIFIVTFDTNRICGLNFDSCKNVANTQNDIFILRDGDKSPEWR